MVDIAIETDSPELVAELERLEGAVPSLTGHSQGWDGVSVATVVLALSAPIVPALVKIIKASIEARRHVRVKKGGITIEGVSEATLLKILETANGEGP